VIPKRQIQLQAKQYKDKERHNGDIPPTVIRAGIKPGNLYSTRMSDLPHPTESSEAGMSDEKRQLQDLSLNDAEALQAFVAKRKWFEVKLKVSRLLLHILPCS